MENLPVNHGPEREDKHLGLIVRGVEVLDWLEGWLTSRPGAGDAHTLRFVRDAQSLGTRLRFAADVLKSQPGVSPWGVIISPLDVQFLNEAQAELDRDSGGGGHRQALVALRQFLEGSVR